MIRRIKAKKNWPRIWKINPKIKEREKGKKKNEEEESDQAKTIEQNSSKLTEGSSVKHRDKKQYLDDSTG